MKNHVDPKHLMARLENSVGECEDSRENLQLSQRSDEYQPHLREGLGCTGTESPIGNHVGPKPLMTRLQNSVSECEDSMENLQLSQRSDEYQTHLREGLGCTGTESPIGNHVGPKPLMARLQNSVSECEDSMENLQLSRRSEPGVHGNQRSHGKPCRSQASHGKATK